MTILANLLQDGPMEIKDCKKQCYDAGMSQKTVERAAQKLGLETIHEAHADGGGHKWTWLLPSSQPNGGLPNSDATFNPTPP